VSDADGQGRTRSTELTNEGSTGVATAEPYDLIMTWPPPPHPANEVTSRVDLAAFVLALRDDFVQRGSEWENPTLDRYLEALAAWIESSPGWYQAHGQSLPTEGDWTFFARALAAAVVYE
jgi:hypothetical protein